MSRCDPAHDGDRADGVLRTAFDDAVAVGDIHEHIALLVVEPDDVEALENEAAALLEYRLTVLQVCVYLDWTYLAAGYAGVTGVFRQSQLAFDPAGDRPADVACHSFDLGVFEAVDDDPVVGADPAEIGAHLACSAAPRPQPQPQGEDEHQDEKKGTRNRSLSSHVRSSRFAWETGRLYSPRGSSDPREPTVPVGDFTFLDGNQLPAQLLGSGTHLATRQCVFLPVVYQDADTGEYRGRTGQGSFAVLRPFEHFRHIEYALVNRVAVVASHGQQRVAGHAVEETRVEAAGQALYLLDQDEVVCPCFLYFITKNKQHQNKQKLLAGFLCLAESGRIVATGLHTARLCG